MFLQVSILVAGREGRGTRCSRANAKASLAVDRAHQDGGPTSGVVRDPRKRYSPAARIDDRPRFRAELPASRSPRLLSSGK
jgi:hypothetical protein